MLKKQLTNGTIIVFNPGEAPAIHCLTQKEAGTTRSMGRPRHLHLEDLPWPVNVLTLNQAVHGMAPGARMVATVKDKDVVVNLRQLLKSQPDLTFHVHRTPMDYRIRIVKDDRGPKGLEDPTDPGEALIEE